jgi:hypothetical protein
MEEFVLYIVYQLTEQNKSLQNLLDQVNQMHSWTQTTGLKLTKAQEESIVLMTPQAIFSPHSFNVSRGQAPDFHVRNQFILLLFCLLR